MAFELWSGASGNLLNVYETEAEALSAVLQVAAVNDREYGAQLGLLHDNGRRSKLVAQGDELIERARRASSETSSPQTATGQRVSA